MYSIKKVRGSWIVARAFDVMWAPLELRAAAFHRRNSVGIFACVTFVLLAFAGLTHAAETPTYYYTDQQGTVLATTDAAGNVLTTTDYRPYGAVARGAPEEGPGYTGHVNDTDTGSVYMQARYYGPAVGRFLSIDPMPPNPGDIYGFNRYGYAGNNPTTQVDPDGRQCAQCLYYPGDTTRQAKINQAASRKALVEAGAVLSTIAPELVPELLSVGSAMDIAGAGESAVDVASTVETAGDEVAKDVVEGSESAFPDRSLPRDINGNPTPDPEASGPYSQLGRKPGRNGAYDQAREFDKQGKPVRDIDFTDHGRPSSHPSPHQHRYIPNPTGGTPQRGPTEPLPDRPIPPTL